MQDPRLHHAVPDRRRLRLGSNTRRGNRCVVGALVPGDQQRINRDRRARRLIMKVSDKAIVFGVLVFVFAIGFYLLMLSPQRQKASELNDQISQLHASISEQESVASYAEQARKDFPRYYGRLVVLGKAVPQQADTASMLVQLNSISDRSHVDFRSIVLGGDAASAGTGTSSSAAASTPAPPSSGSTASAAPAAPATSTAPAASPSSGAPSAGTTSGATATATADPAQAVPATESSAASLPIGATVGTAGLATLPYTLKFTGGFFDIANFIGGVDNLVQPTDGGTRVSPDGRLFTIDGFALNGGAPGSSPTLKASFSVTTYATPADEGLTLGASPSAPAPAAPGAVQAQPASAVVAK
jgi:Tfp pilus assembly protein PilO